MADATRQPWDLPALRAQLEPLWPGMGVELLASVASTNSLLLEQARAGQTAPCLLVAETQTAGRGRQGRAWQAAPGASLTFSLRLLPRSGDWSGLSLAVGLALADALDPPCGAQARRIGLKWPNDLLLTIAPPVLPRKLGGILIESVTTAAGRVAVIGIGLNIAPQRIEGLSQGYACLQEIWPHLDAPQALHRVAAPLLAALRAFDASGFAPLRGRYAQRDLLAGHAVTTSLAELPDGVAEGVDADGALWVRAQGQRHRVVGGEVSVRAEAAC